MARRPATAVAAMSLAGDGGATIDAARALKGVVVAVINIGSGGANAGSARRMAEVFAEAGLPHADVVSVGPRVLQTALRKAIERADALVVLGGDGTIGTAAQLCGQAGKLLIPLAGGTMNMLPRALYGDLHWDQALARTLAAPRTQDVSGGRIGTHTFFCAAILGAPSLWADAREAVRGGHLVEAVKRSVTAVRRHGEDLDYRLGEDITGTAEAVAVICPLVSTAMRDDEPALEAAALEPVAAGAMFRLAFHAIFDDWRRDPSVTRARVQSVTVSGHGRIPVILDGEKVQMGRNVRVDFVPLAFRAIVPAPPETDQAI